MLHMPHDMPPLAKGLTWEQWIVKQPVCDPRTLQTWIAVHGANAPKQPASNRKKL